MLVDESVKVRSLIAPARLRQSGNPLGITPDTAGSGLRFELNRTILLCLYPQETSGEFGVITPAEFGPFSATFTLGEAGAKWERGGVRTASRGDGRDVAKFALAAGLRGTNQDRWQRHPNQASSGKERRARKASSTRVGPSQYGGGWHRTAQFDVIAT
ncbi:hypothetical protein K432DRAFT_448107 [Lepidopterella palustris CBS 459.81]|uniref:Uncharacterized protein n=1 Tax=Lepidopterella palustris CBS 459.81 TaxID=1314670 RepID=A0A8E2J7R2_9PEZI|nr:hypothetical protein K432DRAFT_448107 [Lepidopterella palustris CBS 459.81]